MNYKLYSFLKDNVGLFDFIQQDALDGFWLINIENAEENYTSDRFWEILGYDPLVMAGNNEARNAAVFPEDLPVVTENLIKHTKDINYRSDLTVRFYHQNGKTVWLRFKGKGIPFGKEEEMRVLVAFIDITEVKETESFLTSCNSAARIGHWEVNFENKTVLWSTIVKEIHGVPEVYQPDLDTAINYFKEGHDRDSIAEAVQRAMHRGEGYNIEVILITAQGEERWVKTIGFAEMHQGSCVRLYGTFQDIDERKRAALEMMELLEIKRDQNMRLQNFKNIVSHNLRSHSGNIELMVDMIEKDMPGLPSLESYQMLKSAINNLSETIHHLGEVSKVSQMDESQLVMLSLKDNVDKAIQNVAALAKESEVKIINEVSGEDNILAYPAYLDSVLLNFITNSIKYRSDQRESYVRLYSKTDESWVSLFVEDNGLGIDLNRHRDKLFGMYKTFHENQDARGIGLFITRNHIEAMGGNIEVESEINVGTVFKINFKYEKS